MDKRCKLKSSKTENEIIYEKHCWAEIDVDALLSNFKFIQDTVKCPVCAVVKANAYGHGSIHVARYLQDAGASAFAVSCLAEALQLRTAGIKKPIIILGYTDPAMSKELADNDITTACFSLAYAEELSSAATYFGIKVKVHLKIDTGMGRIGFQARQDFSKVLDELAHVYKLAGLSVEGVFQHFAVADSREEDNIKYTSEQFELFQKVICELKVKGYNVGTVHCSNSAAQLLHPDWHYDMVRAGITLYGLNPSNEVKFPQLEPAMTLKSVVTQVKTLEAGQSTSYGRTFTAMKPTRVATVCVGYADGYPRMLSGNQRQGVMFVNGKAAPVIGRVCMDQTMIDVSNVPDVKIGDEVIVFGENGMDTADTIASKTETINYEIVSGIAQRVPRVYVENCDVVDVGYDTIDGFLERR